MRTLVAAGETPGGECGDCQVDSARGGDAVAWVLDEGVDECEVESSLKKVPTLPYLDRWTHCLTSVELAARKTGKKEKQKRKGVMISSPSTSYRHRRRLLHEKAIHVRSRPSSTLDQSSTCIIHQIRSSTYLPTYPIHHIATIPYLPTCIYLLKNPPFKSHTNPNYYHPNTTMIHHHHHHHQRTLPKEFPSLHFLLRLPTA